MIKTTTGLPLNGMTLHDCSPLQDAVSPARVAPVVQAEEGASILYQLEYTDPFGEGDVIHSGYDAWSTANFLQTLLEIGVSTVTVRVIA